MGLATASKYLLMLVSIVKPTNMFSNHTLPWVIVGELQYSEIGLVVDEFVWHAFPMHRLYKVLTSTNKIGWILAKNVAIHTCAVT